jgi:hypothetical protein
LEEIEFNVKHKQLIHNEKITNSSTDVTELRFAAYPKLGKLRIQWHDA